MPSTRDGEGPTRALVALCVTEITSWGVLYYAFPVMVSVVTSDTGWSTATAMGAFSTGAVVSALAGVWVGRLIDRYGPRPVMTTGSVVGVVAVLAIAAAQNLPAFYGAWVVAGVAQACVLYPPAFVALTRWYGPHRVKALTTVTLLGGLASTVFAPLTAVLLDVLGWRGTYVVLAVVLAVVTVPLHAFLLTAPWPASAEVRQLRDGKEGARAVVRSRPFVVLTLAMAAGALGMYAATVNLVPLLTSRGIGTHLAATALGLTGAGQLVGRLAYQPVTRRTTPTARTAVILGAGAVSVVALGLVPGPAALLIVVAVLAGAVRGAFTLLQATTVADRWGTRSFGHVNGVFSAPITTVIAVAPATGAVLGDTLGGYPTAYGVLALLTAGAAVLTATAGRTPARQ